MTGSVNAFIFLTSHAAFERLRKETPDCVLEPKQMKHMKMKYCIPMIALICASASCDKIKKSAGEKVSSGAEQVAEGVKDAASKVAEEAAAAKEAAVSQVKEAAAEIKAAAEQANEDAEEAAGEATKKTAEGIEEIKEAAEGELPESER